MKAKPFAISLIGKRLTVSTAETICNCYYWSGRGNRINKHFLRFCIEAREGISRGIELIVKGEKHKSSNFFWLQLPYKASKRSARRSASCEQLASVSFRSMCEPYVYAVPLLADEIGSLKRRKRICATIKMWAVRFHSLRVKFEIAVGCSVLIHKTIANKLQTNTATNGKRRGRKLEVGFRYFLSNFCWRLVNSSKPQAKPEARTWEKNLLLWWTVRHTEAIIASH